MPTAMRRWCGSGVPPGSEICSSAMPLLSQRFQLVIDVLGKALNEHEGSDLLRRRRDVPALVERAAQLVEGFELAGGHVVRERLDVVDGMRFLECFAPCH